MMHERRGDSMTACKMWRKAYDSLGLPNSARTFRAALLHNIASSYARMGKWGKAVRYLDNVLSDAEGRELRPMFHKLVCSKALNQDVEPLFQKMVNFDIPFIIPDSAYDTSYNDDETAVGFMEIARYDKQRVWEKRR